MSRKIHFTLLELMVVMGIILILITLLLPSSYQVKEQMKRADCASRLRQIGQIIQAYASNDNGNIPAGEPFYKTKLYYTGVWTDQPEHIGIIYEQEFGIIPAIAYCPGASFLTEDSALFGKKNWGKLWTRSSYQSRLVQKTLDTKLDKNHDSPSLLLDAQFGTSFLETGDGSVLEEQSCHKYLYSNILYYDGTVAGKKNLDGRFSALMTGSLEAPFINADAEY